MIRHGSLQNASFVDHESSAVVLMKQAADPAFCSLRSGRERLVQSSGGSSCSGDCRSSASEATLTKQAAALVRGVDLVAGLRNRLQLLLDLHAVAAIPVTQQALSLFVTSICLVKVSLRLANPGLA